MPLITTVYDVARAQVECGYAFTMFICNDHTLLGCGFNNNGRIGISDEESSWDVRARVKFSAAATCPALATWRDSHLSRGQVAASRALTRQR